MYAYKGGISKRYFVVPFLQKHLHRYMTWILRQTYHVDLRSRGGFRLEYVQQSVYAY